MSRSLVLPDGYKIRCIKRIPHEQWVVVDDYSGRIVSPQKDLSLLKEWIYDHWQDLISLPKLINNQALRDQIISDLRSGEY